MTFDVAMLERVRLAHRRLLTLIERVDDRASREPSGLHGWTRAHLLTHIARNADAQRGMLEGTLRDDVVQMYPGGAEQRQRDIESGAGRRAADLVADVRQSADHLEQTWDQMSEEHWYRSVHARSGIKPAWSTIRVRWQEVELHAVDLLVGATWATVDPQLLAVLVPDLLAGLPARLDPAGPRVVVHHPLAADVAGSEGDDPVSEIVVMGAPDAIFAWLIGRPASGLIAEQAGRAAPVPSLLPWM